VVDRPAADAAFLVVVPTLDSHALLAPLVASLQQQTHGRWRLLFIDGPSGPDHRQALADLCRQDPRLAWVVQEPGDPGIYGAMNQGFRAAGPSDWLLFWGSDDRAADRRVLARLADRLVSRPDADLLVGRARYLDHRSGRPGRSSGLAWAGSLKRSLALGSTPPHQATVFGPAARRRLDRYDTRYRLAADLDYFLTLCRWRDLLVLHEPLELVHLGDGGVSARQTRQRLQEVRQAYRARFGMLWCLPFLLRYGQRSVSLLVSLLAP
jgi:glycosyltransferase involved in cell wall biosynthesis